MPFQYRPRSAEAWDKRANQTSGDFEGFLKDEYKIFKPKKGSNSIRVLPPTFDNADHYGIDIYVHYSVGPNNASVLCLQQMRNERCPICEARNRALKLGEEEEARELKASKRVLVWMLDRNDEDVGPVLWPMPFTLDREFSALAKDKQTGTILPLDDPDEGYDIYFDKNGEGITSKYESKQLARRPSSVADKPLDYIEDRPLPGCLIWRTYDEVKELYEGGAESAPSPREETVTRRRATNGHAHEEAPTRRGRAASEPEPEPEVKPRRRVEPPDEAPRGRRAEPDTRRHEIDDEIPWTDDKKAAEPEEEQPRSAAEKLRERYRR